MVSVFLLVSTAVAIQAPQGAVVGVVRDAATGAPLVGAELVLTDVGRSAVTNQEGRYELTEVPAGPQHIVIRRFGYEERTVHALVPSTGRLELGFFLPVSPVALPGVGVRSESNGPAGGTGARRVFADRTVDAIHLDLHPLLAEPDAFQALAGEGLSLDPETPTGIHVHGGASDQTAYVLDGVPIFSPYHAAGLFSSWNPDALGTVALHSSFRSGSFGESLSGVVAGSVRDPGSRLGADGALSTDQARLTLHGPLGEGGFVMSLRGGFPGLLGRPNEASYLKGEAKDHLGKLELPLLGGRLSLLSYGSESELGVSARGSAPAAGDPADRNWMEWRGGSLGVAWAGSTGIGELHLQGWRATSSSGGGWADAEKWLELDADREDLGVLLSLATTAPQVEVGIRAEQSRTSYSIGSGPVGVFYIAPAGGGDPPDTEQFAVSAKNPIVSLFGTLTRTVGESLEFTGGSVVSWFDGVARWAPSARLSWRAHEQLTLVAGYARSHQYAQSLRGDESVVSYVFPVDLFVGAGHEDVPVARGDLVTAGADWTSRTGLVALGVHAFTRKSRGVVMVSAAEGGPFSMGSFSSGRTAAQGISAAASVTSARYGLLASWTLQEVRSRDRAGLTYTPSYAAEHQVEAGVALFPTATSLLRASVTAAFGRRSGGALGGFEWEACNLLDRGCEFVGTPGLAGPPGGRRLPAYARLDLGVRKHWHLNLGGHDTTVAIFGTLTNVLSRANVLTQVVDSDTGERQDVYMRPFSPLVIGLDWQL